MSGSPKTELLDATSEMGVNAHIARAADLLQAGQLVAFPTDTVYGVAAIANQSSAVAQLYVAKGRPPEKAIPILLADSQDLGIIAAEISDLVHRLIAYFWPGGLTLVLPKGKAVPREVSPTPTVAVRIPALPLTRQIIAAAGTPLAVTSANRSGQPSPRTAGEVMAQLGGRIAAVVDGGPCPGGVPSTILDCTTDPPRLLRAGAIPTEALRKFTPVSVL
jgi:L-threonylcarbamoyladenylate synthase